METCPLADGHIYLQVIVSNFRELFSDIQNQP